MSVYHMRHETESRADWLRHYLAVDTLPETGTWGGIVCRFFVVMLLQPLHTTGITDFCSFRHAACTRACE